MMSREIGSFSSYWGRGARLIEFKLARFWYNSDLILVYFLDNTDKTRGRHFEIQCLRYIYLTRGNYSEISRNP